MQLKQTLFVSGTGKIRTARFPEVWKLPLACRGSCAVASPIGPCRAGLCHTPEAQA